MKTTVMNYEYIIIIKDSSMKALLEHELAIPENPQQTLKSSLSHVPTETDVRLSISPIATDNHKRFAQILRTAQSC